MAEIYKNYDVFQKASKLIKQVKEEKIVKLRKELQRIDPEMDITPKKKNTTECDKKLAPMFQKQLKPVKVRQHNKKKTVHKKGTRNAKVVLRRALASRKNKIHEQISEKYGNGNMAKYGWIWHLETVIDGRDNVWLRQHFKAHARHTDQSGVQ